LCCFFNEGPLFKKSICNTEDSRTVSSDYFSEGRLIAALRLLRQFDVEGVFETIRQMRSSLGNRRRTL
jgi:hypothetical protein